jgi:hypothetical protein
MYRSLYSAMSMHMSVPFYTWGCGQKPGFSKEWKAGHAFRRRTKESNRTLPQVCEAAARDLERAVNAVRHGGGRAERNQAVHVRAALQERLEAHRVKPVSKSNNRQNEYRGSTSAYRSGKRIGSSPAGNGSRAKSIIGAIAMYRSGGEKAAETMNFVHRVWISLRLASASASSALGFGTSAP